MIYYNPRKVHLFVDAETMQPVKSAERVYQIGKATYAMGITYYTPDEIPPAPRGMRSAAGNKLSTKP